MVSESARGRALLAIALSFAGPPTQASADWEQPSVTIPDIEASAKRPITLADVLALRHVDSLSVSPDGHRYAIFVRQADPAANDFRSGWFVGQTDGGALRFVGHGGRVGLEIHPSGEEIALASKYSRWSPDGNWLAYTLERNGETQLWRSRADGRVQEQITHSASDVRDYAWREDGRGLYFSAGATRAEQAAQERVKERQGYRWDEEILFFTDFMWKNPRRALDPNPRTWVVDVGTGSERLGDESDHAAFERMLARERRGSEPNDGVEGAASTSVARADGGRVWLQRVRPGSRLVRVVTALSHGAVPLACAAEQCTGLIQRAWWSERGERVLFTRTEGLNESSLAFYAWSPASGRVETVLRSHEDFFQSCAPAANDRAVCVRQSKIKPPHVVAVDFRARALQVLADVNPEFANIRLGAVERYEWDLPRFKWNEPGGELAGLFDKPSYGYILYPPDFDPKKKYPVFIDPYVAQGFEYSVGQEHAQHVYAANGFVVLCMSYPLESIEASERIGAALQRLLYSPALGYPLLTAFMESTVSGLDRVATRGFIDERRVGIGGVSFGTIAPLYLLQKHDRIAAISISSPHWGPFQYYWPTRKGRQVLREFLGEGGYLMVKPEGAGKQFWSGIDIADHVEAIEAPVLMHLADRESFGLLRLIRHMEEAGKPYDAYVFRNELHLKQQPAHREAILRRNLDWFRFWLQGYEDPDPAKAPQYSRWRELKDQHGRAQRAE